MSKSNECYNNYPTGMDYGCGGLFGGRSCCCSLPTLIILILIILQFSNKGHEDHEDGGILGDNSILFIIAIFFLSCCNPCKRTF